MKKKNTVTQIEIASDSALILTSLFLFEKKKEMNLISWEKILKKLCSNVSQFSDTD